MIRRKRISTPLRRSTSFIAKLLRFLVVAMVAMRSAAYGFAFRTERRRIISPSSSCATNQILRRRPTSSSCHRHPLFGSRMCTRSSSSGGTSFKMTIADTPLGKAAGSALLDGLVVYTVPANIDSHPLSVYGINSTLLGEDEKNNPSVRQSADHDNDQRRRPILLLHGRTWSSVPVYHLLGGPVNSAQGIKGRESRSMMETLYECGLEPYAMDFRGFGGTPPDGTGWVEPNTCVSDVESALAFIAKRHGEESKNQTTSSSSSTQAEEMPALLGWSQGALVAQLVAQKAPHLTSKLILYGSIYDPLVRYPRAPLYASESKKNASVVMNEYDAAIEDFTVEGTIPPEPAALFAEAALLSDPVKAQWKHLYQFNNCDPARVHVPTLVVAGDQDPYAPLHVQSDLFSNLGRGADRTWSIIADADHAVHMLDGRERFVRIVTNFVQNGRKGDKS